MTVLFIADRAKRARAGLSGLAMVAGEGVEYSSDPAYLFTRRPAEGRRVALVSGGGAGHEPMHGGFVGRGGLDAACPGEIFTSPHNRQIYAASAQVALPDGVLHIVKNYTGDVLNFSIAAERLRADGIAVEQVLVDDDWGSRDAGKVGRRGTAATVIVEKVLGAAADAGWSLAELAALGRDVVARSRTVAVASEAHRSPGDGGRAFEVSPGSLEFGVGIHGEPARERIDVTDLDGLVDRMVDALTADLSAPEGVVVLVNGLGGTGQLELLHFGDAAARALMARRVPIRSLVTGAYCTALDMRGVSLTVVDADPEWLPHWYADHGTPGLPRPTVFAGVDDVHATGREEGASTHASPWLQNLADRTERLRDHFNALDQAAGDGDFGDNIAVGVSHAVRRGDAEDDLVADLGHLASAFLDDVGGSSGPLLGLVFGGIASRAADAPGDALAGAVLAGLGDALTAVQRAGGAQRGDRTLVDALAAVVDDAGRRDVEGLDGTSVLAAIEGAGATAEMVGGRGRAAYVGERAIGRPDPGAVAVAWLCALLWQAVTGDSSDQADTALEALLADG
ncbi:dihydroxyacetone kinase [Mycolicibacterium aurum]|uniref:Dihydroxyacetone kinase n=1 Tax=Mycolicibacterium aurum TaxID=1791 RepID=A0A448J0Z6_MYCAU|nr:dihydroxyacetone kinase subunit DhaK [Mycolicibacterium aurum]VEG58217.1 dihydroxyacetone kinase [Mycolicibacterium aurum]